MIITGYFRPPLERPPINNVGFQHANPSNMPAHPMSGSFVILHFFTFSQFSVSPFELPHIYALRSLFLSSGYGVPQMSCRPDIPALNCWRPT